METNGLGLGRLLVVAVLLLVPSGCHARLAPSRSAQMVAAQLATGVARPVARPPLSLKQATTRYSLLESGETAVELRIVLDNRGEVVTNSTSILWEPAFAQHFTFTGSDPAPWRVRIDGQGWGVLDTAGVLSGRTGTYWLRFTAATQAAGTANLRPRIVVVADGDHVLGETLAGPAPPWWLDPSQSPTQRRAAAQTLFERGTLQVAADRVSAIPTDSKGVFHLATGLAVLLSLVVGLGGVMVLRSTTHGLGREG